MTPALLRHVSEECWACVGKCRCRTRGGHWNDKFFEVSVQPRLEQEKGSLDSSKGGHGCLFSLF